MQRFGSDVSPSTGRIPEKLGGRWNISDRDPERRRWETEICVSAVRFCPWPQCRTAADLEPVAEIHEAVRSLAETGFHDEFEAARNYRMNPDL